MNECRDCAFWSLGKPHRCKPDGFGECSCPKFVPGYAEVNADLDGVRVENDEEWGFFTGPLFGCVQWKRREPVDA